MANKKILGIGTVAIVAVAAVVVIILLPQAQDSAPLIGNPITTSTSYAGQNIPISTTVLDDKGVSAVILSWSNDSGATWHNITMAGSGTTTWFGTANIPAQDIEVTVTYKIYAQDTIGQWAMKDNAYSLYTGSRKAIIVNGDDKFFNSSSNEDFNSGTDSNIDASTGNWIAQGDSNTNTVWSATEGVGGTPCLDLDADAPG